MKENTKKILVIGAGCTGLSAAWRLAKKGFKVKVIESASRTGGMAAGTVINGNVFEHGPHIFHSSDAEIMREVKDIAKDDLFPFTRTIKIKFMGEYFNFPLAISDIISKLPPTVVLKAGVSFFYHSLKGLIARPKQENSETVLTRYYGKVLYEIFFKSYIEHVWGIGPSEFSPEFARQRIPKIDLLKAIESLHSRLGIRRRRVRDAQKFVEKVEGELYSTKKGFSGITDKIAEDIRRRGGEIILNAGVKTIIVDRDSRVTGVVYRKDGYEYTEQADAVISTIPLNNMVNMLQPAVDAKVKKAADNLQYRSLVFVGMVINRKKVLPASFMYFRNLTFNRITDLGYFGLDISPSHGTVLVAEISCSTADRYWNDETAAKEAVLSELESEGLISRKEVLECHAYKLEHAYPLYKLDYEKDLEAVLDFTANLSNFRSVGRQGSFAYANAHIAMRIGFDTADEIVSALSS